MRIAIVHIVFILTVVKTLGNDHECNGLNGVTALILLFQPYKLVATFTEARNHRNRCNVRGMYYLKKVYLYIKSFLFAWYSVTVLFTFKFIRVLREDSAPHTRVIIPATGRTQFFELTSPKVNA